MTKQYKKEYSFTTEWMTKKLATAHAEVREVALKSLDKKTHKVDISRLEWEIKDLKKVK